jgi:hypothetical protein
LPKNGGKKSETEEEEGSYEEENIEILRSVSYSENMAKIC